MSYVLRHHPESVGIARDPAGWTDVDDLPAALMLTRAELDHVVATARAVGARHGPRPRRAGESQGGR